MNPVPTFATESLLPAFGVGEIVLFTFYFVIAIYAVFSGVFYYHWQSYGTDAKVTWITYVTYLATTLPLVLIMGVLALVI